MRGRYTAAIWLFAVLLLGLLAVGATAPRPRESARLRGARLEIARRAAQARLLIEDASIRPETGCMRDRRSGGSANEKVTVIDTATVTSSVEACDPSGRDFAYHQLVSELRQQWVQQPSELQPATIAYVSTDVSADSTWTAWQSHLINDLGAALDGLRRTATEALETAYDRWQAWTQITAEPDLPEISPLTDGNQSVETDSTDIVMGERVERSILVRSETNGANRAAELAERYEQSILIR